MFNKDNISLKDDVDLLYFLQKWLIHHTIIKKKRPSITLFLDSGASKNKILEEAGTLYWDFIDIQISSTKADNDLLNFLRDNVNLNTNITFIVVSNDKGIIDKVEYSNAIYGSVSDFVESILKSVEWCDDRIFKR